MDTRSIQIAEACLRGAEDNTMTFPEIVGRLMQDGFESYSIDYRRAKAIYYRLDGDSVELPTQWIDTPVAQHFDAPVIQAAIREAQQLVPGYTYSGFCKKVMHAGCVGYCVSFTGRRAVYYGRTAALHIEHFPE